MPRYFLQIAYNGKSFKGWQTQANAPSVQDFLQEKLSILCKEKITLTGTGRTDTGVHALYYVAHADLPTKIDDKPLFLHKLNALLGDKVCVADLHAVHDDAHARFDALYRRYVYHLSFDKEPFVHEYSLRLPKKPDIHLMQDAASELLGSKDFEVFAKQGSPVSHHFCEVQRSEFEDLGGRLAYHVQANRFLYGMVRSIVGTLLEVGYGNLSLAEFKSLIAEKDRQKASKLAPAHALFFHSVDYSYYPYTPCNNSEQKPFIL